MKRINFTVFVIIGFFSTQVFAQCDKCGFDTEMDYCFQSENYEGFCAGFMDSTKNVLIISGKKSKSFTYDLEEIERSLITIASAKKPKIKPLEILFLQEALESWKVEKRKIGYEFEESGLGLKIINEGQGEFPEKGKPVKVHYTGWLLEGKKFDSSVDRGQPFSFVLGQGRVIKGWDEGIAKLKIGTRAFLYIPPELGYGSRGAGRNIPPDATLIFEVEVLE
jgi:FKBP-type peptidyl-prolyl cis-trans isomerase